jgi:hypothetical protein
MQPLTPEERLMGLRDLPTEGFIDGIQGYLPPECDGSKVKELKTLAWDLRERALQQFGEDGWYSATIFYLSKGKGGIEFSKIFIWSWSALSTKPQDWIIIALLLEFWRPKYDR